MGEELDFEGCGLPPTTSVTFFGSHKNPVK